MNKTLSTILIVIVALVVAAGLFFGGMYFSRAMVSDRIGSLYMMDRYSRGNAGPAGTSRGACNPTGGPGYGLHPGRMGMYGFASGLDIEPLTIDEARTAVEEYLADLGNADLKIDEIMIFDNNAYVSVVEDSTGIGAFELLVDPLTSRIVPEQGPNRMWNTRYGMAQNSMLNTGPSEITTEMTVSADEAIQFAQDYLDEIQPGATVSETVQQFYGYYTIDTLQDGEINGMLSVNGYNGQVWLHVWHGEFIEASEGE